VGRLVKRKGVAWFAAQVMPKLPKEYVYLVAGEGPERGLIESVIAGIILKNACSYWARYPMKSATSFTIFRTFLLCPILPFK
jgi:hypothetical protein